MNNETLHVIIAPYSLDRDGVKYRRHRLAEFLKKQDNTKEVFWIYPVSANIKRPKSYVEGIRILRKNYEVDANNNWIIEFALPNFMMLDYMRYKYSFGSLTYRKLKKIIRSYQLKKVLWFTCPAFPYISTLLKWDAIVYDCSDLWTAPTNGINFQRYNSIIKNNLCKGAESKIIKYSDIIFTTSKYLEGRINKKFKRSANLVENGVELTEFCDKKSLNINVDALEQIPRPRLGFVGGMKVKIDFNLLDKLAKRNPDWSIVLIGPGPSSIKKTFNELIKNKNVFFLGAIKPHNVPAYMSKLDLGLLPYKEIEYNKAVFPLKLYEYLLCGLPVVGCGLPSTQHIAHEKVYNHVNSNQFEDKCREVIYSLSHDNNYFYKKRIEIASKSNWEKKFRYMHELLLKTLGADPKL